MSEEGTFEYEYEYEILCIRIFDAEVARPAHATWYVPTVSSPPALQALT